jgi:hypothetical protein
MAERSYPYKAWTLMPSFKPVEVEFREKYASWSFQDYGDVTTTGKLVARVDIFPTKDAAIAGGWERIHAQEAVLEKRMAAISKKRAALAKAAE